jgi:putative redox protein
MATNKTVKVTATGPEKWVVTTKAGTHVALVDQPEAMGGEDKGPSPLDYLFVSLAGCLITIGKIVAGQNKINLRGMEVEISGELNLEVLRGQEKNERSGFKNIVADVKIDADLSDEEKKAFLEEVDRRCPISDNILYTTPVEINVVG